MKISMENLMEEAESFFDEYRSVFDTGNMALFSRRFTEPFISMRPDGSIRCMPTHTEAENFFTSVFNSWREEGYEFFSIADYDVNAIGSDAMLVTLTWEMRRRNSNLIRSWRQSYNLVRSGSSWMVYTSTFHK